VDVPTIRSSRRDPMSMSPGRQGYATEAIVDGLELVFELDGG
jgi:hypothetical protein